MSDTSKQGQPMDLHGALAAAKIALHMFTNTGAEIDSQRRMVFRMDPGDFIQIRTIENAIGDTLAAQPSAPAATPDEGALPPWDWMTKAESAPDEPSAAQGKIEPLTYEQEVHALLWAGLSSTRDLILCFEAQDKLLKGDEKRINRKAIEHLQETVRRLDALIPRALERRDAVASRPAEPAKPSAGMSPEEFYHKVYDGDVECLPKLWAFALAYHEYRVKEQNNGN